MGLVNLEMGETSTADGGEERQIELVSSLRTRVGNPRRAVLYFDECSGHSCRLILILRFLGLFQVACYSYFSILNFLPNNTSPLWGYDNIYIKIILMCRRKLNVSVANHSVPGTSLLHYQIY